jgi:diaminohydroxyphosphoribosylaminopyrimidine deaminase/5-amino-6-(5-phosphoribosylamino)uracil reductase
VVIATLDANPVVRGNGVSRLRQAGIVVDIGMGEHEAQQLNNAFAKYIRTGLPWVTLKSALSLDERIAPPPSARKEKTPAWLTSEAARAEVQRMRHAHDALLTGIGTVLADDPLLTDRSGLPRRRPLLRVILDSQLRLPLNAKLLEAVNEDVLIFTSSTDAAKADGLRTRGAHVEVLEAGANGISLQQVFARLGELKITSVMIEAGTHLNTTALAGNFVDELVVFKAPITLGIDAVPFVEPPVHLPPVLCEETTPFGPDTCTRKLFKTWWV